jgi:hypothetical protein
MATRIPLLILLAASLSLQAAGSSQKQPTVPPPSTKTTILEQNVKEILLLMDTDKNGKISRKEWMDFMAAEFDRLDTDKSGELDPRELLKSKMSFRAFRFAEQGK